MTAIELSPVEFAQTGELTEHRQNVFAAFKGFVLDVVHGTKYDEGAKTGPSTFPGQQSQVPTFQYRDWFERQPTDKQVGFAD